MEKEEIYEKAEKLLETTNLSDKEKTIILRTARKQAERYLYSQYEEWEKYQKERNIEGKYSDDEVIKRLITKFVGDQIAGKQTGANQER